MKSVTTGWRKKSQSSFVKLLLFVPVRLINNFQGRFLSQGLTPSKKWAYYKSFHNLKERVVSSFSVHKGINKCKTVL